MRRIIILAAAAAAALALAGCSQDDITSFQSAQSQLAEDPAALDGLFQAEITFCERVTRSGRPLRPLDSVVIGEGNDVHGHVAFANAEPGRLYSLHLVWRKPDGGKLFRRWYDVVVEEGEDGFTAKVTRRKAEDLTYRRTSTQTADEPGFQLSSKLGSTTSGGAPREPGEYIFTVYLHREVLLERRIALVEG
ncbi:MAG: hypothetical protein JW819_04930 [Candidatus Krumholzibacteriota bacterium]|nr:hypothetical protein [Candidatus Krumholzibacteriota bacterium]